MSAADTFFNQCIVFTLARIHSYNYTLFVAYHTQVPLYTVALPSHFAQPDRIDIVQHVLLLLLLFLLLFEPSASAPQTET